MAHFSTVSDANIDAIEDKNSSSTKKATETLSNVFLSYCINALRRYLNKNSIQYQLWARKCGSTGWGGGGVGGGGEAGAGANKPVNELRNDDYHFYSVSLR